MSLKVLFYYILYILYGINMLFVYYAIYGNMKIYENKLKIFTKNLQQKGCSHDNMSILLGNFIK